MNIADNSRTANPELLLLRCSVFGFRQNALLGIAPVLLERGHEKKSRFWRCPKRLWWFPDRNSTYIILASNAQRSAVRQL